MTITPQGQARRLRRECLADLVEAALKSTYADDPKEMHYALLVLRIEEENVGPNRDLMTMDVLSTMDRHHLHELLREWLRRETQ